MAKFEWNGAEFELSEKQGIKANDYKKIKKVIDDKPILSLNVGKNILKNKEEQL